MAQSVKFEAHFPAWFGPHRKHAARFEGSKSLCEKWVFSRIFKRKSGFSHRL
jgi:hypothetical protein